jgi:hypothetical protein
MEIGCFVSDTTAVRFRPEAVHIGPHMTIPSEVEQLKACYDRAAKPEPPMPDRIPSAETVWRGLNGIGYIVLVIIAIGAALGLAVKVFRIVAGF